MGTCRRPSWTPMVAPTISGTMVDQRDQVLITVFSPERPSASTFFSSLASTAGPFLIDLDILLLTSPLDNQPIRSLGLTRLIAQGRLTPGCLRSGQAYRGPAFAATMGMVTRGHRRPPHRGAYPQPPLSTRLAQADTAVVNIAQLPDSRQTVAADAPQLARGQPDQG